MKFVVSQSDLLVALTATSQAIPSRPSHTVLGCFHVVAHAESITVRGFDLAMGIEFTIPANVDTEGTIVIPGAKQFKEIVSKLNDGEITIEFDDDSQTIKLAANSGVYEFQTTSPDEYPDIPVPENEPIELYSQPLKAGFESVLYAVSFEETKQLLTGVNIKAKDGFLYFAGTDGHRLSTCVVANDLGELPEVTIPKYAISAMLKMLPNYETDVIHISCDKTGIEFKSGNIRIYSRVLEGAYPRYDQLVPTQFLGVVRVNRVGLLKALDRVSVLAESRNAVVKCSFGMLGIATISSESDGSKGQEQLTIQSTTELFQGESEYNIAFNVKYLVDALKSFTCNEIALNLNKPTSPVILKPVDDGEFSQLGLLMPVQLRD